MISSRLAVASALLCAAACGEDARPPPDPDPTPWDWRDAVVYQLVTDRFANGDPTNDGDADPLCNVCYHGGDWQGVIDQLGYLEGLGVNVIWISPVVDNTDSPLGRQAYHGYWPVALDRPNPRFGDRATLAALCDAAAARGIRVIVDVVINHMGPIAYYDINENGALDTPGSPGTAGHELAPPFAAGGVQNQAGTGPAPFIFFAADQISPAALRDPSWYHRAGQITDWGDPTQTLRGDFRGGLRDLATDRAEVRALLAATVTDWLEELPIAGVRVDAAKHADAELWAEALPAWRAAAAAARDLDDGLLSAAEVFDGNLETLADYTGTFDSMLNFAFKYQVVDDVFVRGGATTLLEQHHRNKETAFSGDAHATGPAAPPARLLFNFLDNHDVPRFLNLAPSRPALHAALAYLLTTDGVPALYYGTEQELSGGIDPDNREDLWPTAYAQTGETFTWIARLTALRHAHEALRRGETRFVYVTAHVGAETDAGIAAFERVTANERLLVVINTSATESSETRDQARTMQVGFAPGTVLTPLLDNAGLAAHTVAGDGSLLVALPPKGVAVFAP